MDFWTQPPPLGVVSAPRKHLLDIDEFGLELRKANWKRGHGNSSLRVRKPGHYSKAAGLSVLYAIGPGDSMLPVNQLGSILNPPSTTLLECTSLARV